MTFLGRRGRLSPLRPSPSRRSAWLTPARALVVSLAVLLLSGWVVTELAWRSPEAGRRLTPILVTLFGACLLVVFFVGQRRVSQWMARRAASDRRYRSLVEGAPNAVMLLRDDGRVISVNQNGLALFGLPESEVLGRTLADLWPEAERGPARDAVERARERAERTGFVAACSRGAEPRLLELVLNPLPDDDEDSPASIVVVGTDVTDRQRARTALERSHRLTQAILASSARFVSLRSEDVDEAIQSALREVGAFLEVDRTQLCRVSDDGRTFSITHEWCAPGVPPRIGDLQEVALDEYPWLWTTIESSQVAAVSDLANLPPEASRLRESLARQRVSAFACVAVHRGGKAVGFLGLDVLGRRRDWPNDEVGLLQVEAEVLSNALARKAAEGTIRDSEQRFVKAFRNSPAPMMIVHLRDERVTEVNEAFLRAFGMQGDQVLGRTVDQLHLYANQDELDTVRRFLGSGLPMRDFEVVLRSGAGDTRHGMLSVDLFEAGGETFYLAVLADLTERRRAEEALREREEIFRSISSAAQDAVIMIDPEGRVTVWNEAAEHMFGYSRVEAVGAPVHDLLVPERYEPQPAIGLAQFSHTGDGPLVGSTQQIAARRSDGTEIPVELSVSAVRLRGGWHAVAIIRDITERLKVEEALWNAKEEAEAANLELQRSVERANRLAEEAAVANAAKSEFLANMSHEIRTPMNGIIGMSGLLLDTELTPEQREYGETVRNCADSLLTIINDILDFSKIEAGRLDLEAIDFDLVVMLEETTDVLAVRAHEKGLELTCLVDPAVPRHVRGDPGRLRQVLMNLVGNAVKFTASGEVGIGVEVEEDGADGMTLRFRVTDTGIGIAAGKLPLLFQPFTQVDSSTTRRFGGTGLGLSISRQLAELMGGRIGVESEEGRGSTFWFTCRVERSLRAAPAVPTGDIEGLRVLAVDDNATNRQVLRGMLAGWGCRGEVVDGGAAALGRLREAAGEGDPFRVAILDMGLKDVPGDEVGRQVRSDPALGATILVMMTSSGRRGEVNRLGEIGFSGYLTKPVKGTHLYDTLRMLVQRATPGKGVQSLPVVTRFTVAEAARRRTRILLAEDNVTNQRVARAVLEKMGHHVDVVVNGLDALRALAARSYDIVLMDIQMPEMDGLEATRAIRSGGHAVRNPAVPIVAMTAHVMKGDRERCFAAGMDDYVAKPLRPAELEAAIARSAKADAAERAPQDGGAGGAPQKDEAGGADTPRGASPRPNASTADGADATVAFERGLLLERLGGDEVILDQIVKVFLEDAPQQLTAMQAASDAGDTTTLRRLAHTVKGSAGTVGATGLQAAAAGLEQAVDRSDSAASRELLAVVRDRYALVERAMSGWLTREERA
jgi:PAS domain S-box-containing protein